MKEYATQNGQKLKNETLNPWPEDCDLEQTRTTKNGT